MGYNVFVIDETLGEPSFVVHLLEELEQVASVVVADTVDDLGGLELSPDVLILGANRLDLARQFRRRYPRSTIIGRGPWQGQAEGEFFPWGDQLREPSLPLTEIVPKAC